MTEPNWVIGETQKLVERRLNAPLPDARIARVPITVDAEADIEVTHRGGAEKAEALARLVAAAPNLARGLKAMAQDGREIEDRMKRAFDEGRYDDAREEAEALTNVIFVRSVMLLGLAGEMGTSGD